LAKHSSSTDNAFAVNEEIIAENIDKRSGVRYFGTRGDGGVKSTGNCFPAVFFEDLHNSGRLKQVRNIAHFAESEDTHFEIDMF
jgi:hypothetical protein